MLAAAQGLSRAPLTTVTYYGLESDGRDWDHGTHHTATMGVELASTGGQRFVAHRARRSRLVGAPATRRRA